MDTSGTGDAWRAPGQGADGPSDALGPKSPALIADSDPMAVAKALLADLQARPIAYAMCGFGYLAVTFAAIGVILGFLFVGVGIGAASNDETLMVVGGSVGMIGYAGGLFVFTLVGVPLMTASMIRAFDHQLHGGAEIGFSSTFSRMRDDQGRLGRVVGFNLMLQMLILVGILFLYIPGLIVAIVGLLALPIVVLEPDVSPMEAMSLAWGHMRKNAGWHVAVWLIMIGILLVAELSVIGLLFIWPLMVGYQTIAYHKAFGPGGARAALAAAEQATQLA